MELPEVNGMRYDFSPEWTARAREIAAAVGMVHIPAERIACVKSKGTKTRNVIARIHSLGKVMQLGMQEEGFYVIELISERFDREKEEEQVKTIIHELLHIPHGFGGGFRHHKPYVNSKTVEKVFNQFREQGCR